MSVGSHINPVVSNISANIGKKTTTSQSTTKVSSNVQNTKNNSASAHGIQWFDNVKIKESSTQPIQNCGYLNPGFGDVKVKNNSNTAQKNQNVNNKNTTQKDQNANNHNTTNQPAKGNNTATHQKTSAKNNDVGGHLNPGFGDVKVKNNSNTAQKNQNVNNKNATQKDQNVKNHNTTNQPAKGNTTKVTIGTQVSTRIVPTAIKNSYSQGTGQQTIMGKIVNVTGELFQRMDDLGTATMTMDYAPGPVDNALGAVVSGVGKGGGKVVLKYGDDIVKVGDDALKAAEKVTSKIIGKGGDDVLKATGKTASKHLDDAQKIESATKTGIKGGLETLSSPSSKVLRQNMIDAGIDVPDYANAAHHIVAGSSPKAAEAREILQKYDVTIQKSAKSKSGAEIIKINNPGGGKNISQVQVSPGGGRHGSNPYIKISTTDQGIIKIIDGLESLYKTDGKETATIVFSGGN